MQEAQYEQPQGTDGEAIRRKALITTSVSGAGASLIGLASRGPGALFIGVLVTGSLIALETHANSKEYVAIAKCVAPGARALARLARRHAPKTLPQPKDVTQVQVSPIAETEPLPPARTYGARALRPVQQEDAMGTPVLTSRAFGNDAQAIFPLADDDKTLRVGKVIETGVRFDPPINMLLGRGMIIAGSQGAGKSNLTGLIAACACKCYMSIVVFDLKREFYTLTEVIPNGIRAGHESFADEAGEGYYCLNAENAADFAEVIMLYGFQAIIDIPSYNGNNDEVAEVMAALLNGLMDWSQHQQERDRLPCLVFTDEAHNFLPEDRKISSMPMKKESADRLQSAYSRILNTGRSYGYTMLMATQRIANIAKWSIANLQVKVVMAHAEKNDLDRCEEEVGKDVADRAIVKTLAQGTGIVVGFTKDPYIVRFDKQPARHVSHTPEIERAHNRHKYAQRPRISQVLTRSEKPSYEQEDEYSPFETYQSRVSRSLSKANTASRSVQERRVARRNERLYGTAQTTTHRHAVPPETPETHKNEQDSVALRQDEQQVLEAYRAGYKTGNAIAGMTGISGTRVNQCLNKLSALGLIDWQPKTKL